MSDISIYSIYSIIYCTYTTVLYSIISITIQLSTIRSESVFPPRARKNTL